MSRVRLADHAPSAARSSAVGMSYCVNFGTCTARVSSILFHAVPWILKGSAASWQRASSMPG